MAKGSSGFSAAGKRSNSNAESEPKRARAETTAFSRVTNQDIQNYIGKTNVDHFVPTSSKDTPQSITINGVKFEKLWMNERSTGGGKEYVTTYQSSRQSSNGEYPVVEVVVKEVRRAGRIVKYEYDKKRSKLV